jgi:hypothetical protein
VTGGPDVVKAPAASSGDAPQVVLDEVRLPAKDKEAPARCVRPGGVSCYAKRPSMRALLLVPCFLVGSACRPCPVEVPQLGPDGGVAACVTSADCMRPPSTLLCGSTEDRLRDCVDCIGRRCIRFVPEACP